MNTKSPFRGSRTPPHLEATTAPYLRFAVGKHGTTSLPFQATPASPRLDPSVYHSSHFSNELMQYHISLANVQTMRHLNASATLVNRTDDDGGRPMEDYFPKPMVYGSALADQELNRSRANQETAIRDMNQPLEHCNVTPKHEDQRAMQYHRSSSYNQEVPHNLNHLRMQGRLEPHPFANRFVLPRIEHTPFLGPSCGGGGESAFSRPVSHAESSAAYSSLDMEIRRLRGMITRVEMLKEKYKHQDGTLQYPRAHSETHAQDVQGRHFSAAHPNDIMAWYNEQQRQQAAYAGNRSSYSNGYPLQHGVSQLFDQNHRVNKGALKQQAIQQARCATAPVRKIPTMYLPESHKDVMPRIVEVRSLAQGAGQQAVYPDKPQRLHPENALPKVLSTPKHSVSSESSRYETGSVESLDSGVECMSSPTDAQSQRSLAGGYSRFKQVEDMYAKDGVAGKLDSYQLCTPPGTWHFKRRPGPALSPPFTKTNRKRVLPNTIVKTMTKKPKSGIKNSADETKLTEIIPQHAPSVPRENDYALDFRLKKGQDRGSLTKMIHKFQTQTYSDNGEMNLSVRNKAGVVVHANSFPADTCPSGFLHHHGKAASMEDLVALSVKLANEVPRGEKGRDPIENRSQDQQLETRRRFILKLTQRAEGMLLERPDLVPISRETETPELAASSDTREYKSTTAKTPTETVEEDKTCTTNSPEDGSSKTPESAESSPKPSKNPLYIDAMVNATLRVSMSPPSKEDIERHEMFKSFDSPSEKWKNPVYQYPDQLFTSQDEIDNDSCNIPAASSLSWEPRKSEELGSTAVVSESNGNTPCPCLEKTLSDQTHAAQSPVNPKLQPFQISKSQPTKNFQYQPAQHSKSNSTRNSPTAPEGKGSLKKNPMFPEVRVLLRPLQLIAPKTVFEASAPVRKQKSPWVQAENVTKVPTTNQEAPLSKLDDFQDNLLDANCSAPNFRIPTEDGFQRMQKVDARIQEIYRVKVLPVEVVQSKNPRKQIQKAFYNVKYREMTFPCVLRSEVPFVPTLLLVQDLFPGIAASRVCRAIQRCNILNRYMICYEQEALQDHLRRRGITSCKLLPLDELHDNWDEILRHISRIATPTFRN